MHEPPSLVGSRPIPICISGENSIDDVHILVTKNQLRLRLRSKASKPHLNLIWPQLQRRAAASATGTTARNGLRREPLVVLELIGQSIQKLG